MKKISPDDLVCMDDFTGLLPLRVDQPYKSATHPENIFKTAIYRTQAKCWLHRDLAAVVCLAAQEAWTRRSLRFVIRDGLRTVEAQERMAATDLVRANPSWMEEPYFLSPPGRGGHPRGMAVDITLETENGQAVDMGCPFDDFSGEGANKPCRRDFTDLPPATMENRAFLETVMMFAADDLGQPLVPLSNEWWDFRLPADTIKDHAPLSDHDLPPAMKMVFYNPKE